MKSAAQIITPAMERSVAQEIAKDWKHQPIEPPKLEKPIAHPCGTYWQRKWLRLDCWHRDVQRIATDAERFAGRWFKNKEDCERLLVLAGHTGCGKTHAAKAVYRFAKLAATSAADQAFWQWPPTIWFTEWPTLARAITEANNPMDSLLTDSIDTDLLFLDDIGAESDKYKTGETVDALCQLLSKRAGRWTLVTTNIQPADWPTRFDARVADRLCRQSRILDLGTTGSYSTQ